MRPSGVAQSFRALVSKFNNQIPLGTKESNRLLTALTSSFRKELDKAHPTSPVRDDNKRPSPSSNKHHKTDRHDIHSSAGLADRHLASVLTNPLLAKAPSKPALDAVTAEAEMDDGANPLHVLESYQRQNHDTLDLTMACMRRLRLSMKHLPHEEQVAKVQEMQAGKRLLSWLWNGKHMNTQAYADHRMLQDALVWFVMMEGQEELLWQWLNSDVELPPPGHHNAPRPGSDPRYMWKARILYAMVRTELKSPQGKQAGSADGALKIYLRAVRRFHDENASVSEKLTLTHSAHIALHRALTRSPGCPNTSPVLYDQFTFTLTNKNMFIRGLYRAQKVAMDEFNRATLNLWHPTKPSGDLLHQSLMGTSPNSSGYSVAEWLAQDESVLEKGSSSVHHMLMLLRAAKLLQGSAQPRKARELIAMAEKICPGRSSEISARWREFLSGIGPHSNDNQEKQRHLQSTRQRDPDWLSQYFPATT